MNIEFVLEPDADQTQEVFRVTLPDGRVEEMRIHEYGRVYDEPGLYEAVVQDRLECRSPATLASSLVAVAQAEGVDIAGLSALDLGAGNGLVGEHLRAAGVAGSIVGQDAEPAAAGATDRDRPGTYEEFLSEQIDDLDLAAVVAQYDLSCLVGAGALGMGHIERRQIETAWGAFGPGSWLAVTFHESVLTESGGELRAFVDALLSAGELRLLERFRHRLTMTGEAIHYYVMVARKAS